MKKTVALLLALFMCSSFCMALTGCDETEEIMNRPSGTMIVNPTDTLGDCTHVWQFATCQSPSTCIKCFATVGEPLSEHSYRDGKCVHCQAVDPNEKE